MGTPPGGDRPLTVRKKRTTRASVSDRGLDEPLSEMTPENLNKLNSVWKVNGELPPLTSTGLSYMFTGQPTLQDDPDLTPKAKADLPRTISAGAFLKSEFHRRSLDIEEGTYSVRGQRHSLYPRNGDLRRHPNTSTQKWSPTIPERRPSKSKNFFLRAFGGRNSDETKSIKRTDSTLSRNTLVRRRSRIKNKVSASYDASYEDNVSSVDGESGCPRESFDIVDVGINSRMFCETPLSYSASVTTSITANDNVFVLCPQIKVTPEVTSVDNGNCDLWVAIEITGVLHRADGREASPFISCPDSFGI
jgi:hypothetical protein